MNISILSGTVAQVLPQGQKAGGVILQNNSEEDIYLGGADVTADDGATGGYVLKAGRELALSDGGGVDLSTRVLHAVHAEEGPLNLTILSI